MGADLIPLLQMGIWVIVAIMIGMVALYFYLMKPSNAKNIYNSNNNNFSEENIKYNKKQYVDDGLSNNEDDGPIQNL